MQPYGLKVETLTFGGLDYQIRSLSDRDQYFDPEGLAEARGVPPANWSFFGLVWASGRQLAETMSGHDLAGKRILEIGCGLALGGIVSQRRHADVTASDRHPLAGPFLAANLALNGLPAMPFLDVDWTRPPASLGRFDLLLASDVLYEAGHPLELSRFVDAHLQPGGEVIVVDPGRHRQGQLSHHLSALGLACTEVRPDPAGKMRILHYRVG